MARFVTYSSDRTSSLPVAPHGPQLTRPAPSAVGHGKPLPYTLDEITILVTCFLRFDKLAQFLKSVRQHYPGLHVVVSDNSLREGETLPQEARDLQQHPQVTWVQCPFDCGVSGVRNHAFPYISTPLTLLCEEDFIFTHETSLEAMLDVLNHTDADLVSGLLRDNRGPAYQWSGRFTWTEEQVLQIQPLQEQWSHTAAGHWHQSTDLVMNWFLTSTDTLRRNPCDEQFKSSHEHLDWLLRFHQSGLKLRQTTDSIVLHDKSDRSPLYQQHRLRSHLPQLYSKWNLTDHVPRNIEQLPGIGPYRELTPPSSGNTLLLTIGHTGSSVVADLLQRLGWQLPDDDPDFHEPRHIRDLNDRLRRGEALPLSVLQDALDALPQPWVLKDPRFCETLEAWLPALVPYQPRLLHLTRDWSHVRASYLRRGENVVLAERRLQAAQQHIRWWPWQQQEIALESIAAWVAEFDGERV